MESEAQLEQIARRIAALQDAGIDVSQLHVALRMARQSLAGGDSYQAQNILAALSQRVDRLGRGQEVVGMGSRLRQAPVSVGLQPVQPTNGGDEGGDRLRELLTEVLPLDELAAVGGHLRQLQQAVDERLPVFEDLQDRLDEMEARLSATADTTVIARLHRVEQDLQRDLQQLAEGLNQAQKSSADAWPEAHKLIERLDNRLEALEGRFDEWEILLSEQANGRVERPDPTLMAVTDGHLVTEARDLLAEQVSPEPGVSASVESAAAAREPEDDQVAEQPLATTRSTVPLTGGVQPPTSGPPTERTRMVRSYSEVETGATSVDPQSEPVGSAGPPPTDAQSADADTDAGATSSLSLSAALSDVSLSQLFGSREDDSSSRRILPDTVVRAMARGEVDPLGDSWVAVEMPATGVWWPGSVDESGIRLAPKVEDEALQALAAEMSQAAAAPTADGSTTIDRRPTSETATDAAGTDAATTPAAGSASLIDEVAEDEASHAWAKLADLVDDESDTAILHEEGDDPSATDTGDPITDAGDPIIDADDPVNAGEAAVSAAAAAAAAPEEVAPTPSTAAPTAAATDEDSADATMEEHAGLESAAVAKASPEVAGESATAAADDDVEIVAEPAIDVDQAVDGSGTDTGRAAVWPTGCQRPATGAQAASAAASLGPETAAALLAGGMDEGPEGDDASAGTAQRSAVEQESMPASSAVRRSDIAGIPAAKTYRHESEQIDVSDDDDSSEYNLDDSHDIDPSALEVPRRSATTDDLLARPSRDLLDAALAPAGVALAPAAAAAPIDREALRRQLLELLPELLRDPAIQQQLFALLATEALLRPTALGELTGLRSFLREELQRTLVTEDESLT